jgi:hypothetical protein
MKQTSKERQRPLRPSCHGDPSGPGRRAGPAEHHVAAPAAEQRPKGPRAPHGESATWHGKLRPGLSGCRIVELVTVGTRCARSQRRPLDPKRPARAHEAREAEWRGRAGPAGPGAGAAGREQGSPGGGVARSRSGDGPARGPAQEGQQRRDERIWSILGPRRQLGERQGVAAAPRGTAHVA